MLARRLLQLVVSDLQDKWPWRHFKIFFDYNCKLSLKTGGLSIEFDTICHHHHTTLVKQVGEEVKVLFIDKPVMEARSKILDQDHKFETNA